MYSLKEVLEVASSDVKMNLKDPAGKASDNFIGFKLEYEKPNLDPDERSESKAVASGGSPESKKGILKIPKP